MNALLDPQSEFDLQMQHLWADRTAALAVFVDGPAREKLRRYVQECFTYAEHRLEDLGEDDPKYRVEAYIAKKFTNIHVLMNHVDADRKSDVTQWEIRERGHAIFVNGLPAHLAFTSLRRVQALFRHKVHPQLLTEIALQFTSSEEGEAFLYNQAMIFLSKMDMDVEEDDLNSFDLREMTTGSLRNVHRAVKAVPIGEYPR